MASEPEPLTGPGISRAAAREPLPPEADPGAPAWWADVLLPLIFLIAATSAWGFLNRHQFNPDGVAFLRIAEYYAGGQFETALSGYWGPFFSWIMVPFVKLVPEPHLAGRIAMGISALVFWAGVMAFLGSLRLDRGALVVAAWITAFTAAVWSGRAIVADLLLSGLIALALREILACGGSPASAAAVRAGFWLGLAYLTKAVALPAALVLIGGLVVLKTAAGVVPPRSAWRNAGLTLAVTAAVAAPWIIMLSLKYGRPLFATSGPINYSYVSPQMETGEVDLYFNRFHRPEPGRVTTWEEPSLIDVPAWSPTASFRNMIHQARVVARNVAVVVRHWAAFDWFGLGLASALLGFLVHAPWRDNMRRDGWRWCGAAALALTVPYLPIRCDVARYHFPAWACLLAASLGFAGHLARGLRGQAGTARRIGLIIVAVSFLYPPIVELRDRLAPPILKRSDGVLARRLAGDLESHGLKGPVAQAGEPRSFMALFVAYHLGQPWFGQDRTAGPDGIAGSGARLVIVHRTSPLIGSLDGHALFRDLDSVLYPTPASAAAFHWKCYEIRSGS